MNCAECGAILVELDDARGTTASSLTQSARREAEDHLVHCSACRAERALAARATSLLRALPPLAPSAGFDARVLARFFAERTAAAAALVPAPRLPRWVRRVAIGYAAGLGTVGAALATWVLAGGGAAELAHRGAALLGSLAVGGASATRAIVDVLASIVVTARILTNVAAILRSSFSAVGRGLHPSPLLGLAWAIAVAALALAIRAYRNRTPHRRRSHNVHAIFWTA